MIYRTSSAHEEGGERDFAISTKSFSGTNGKVEKLHGIRVEWQTDSDGRRKMVEIPGTEFEIEVDLVLLAMGFLYPQREGLLTDLGVELDGRGNVKADTKTYATSVPGVYACGDMRRGQSLIVWAIAEGREAARNVDTYLTQSESALPLAGAKRF
jgi:glutamate synthase (NADPH/NADH) small chain